MSLQLRFRSGRVQKMGFTRIEALTVIAAIAVLAGILFSVFQRRPSRARLAHCISNLREIGLAMQLYCDDHDGRYPVVVGAWQSFRFGGGDGDAYMNARFGMPSATNRPLWKYTTRPDIYRCPADRGMDLSPYMQPFASLYDTVGTSYKYNNNLWGTETTRRSRKDPAYGVAGKHQTWLSDPARYILVNEPPASPYFDGNWHYFFWHEARGPSTISSLTQAGDRSISPVLFADGHTAVFDFTSEIRSNPTHPFEPSRDWYWYESAP